MRFLVADDHQLIRDAVMGLLTRLYPEAEFDEAESWATLSAAARPDANHDLAIVDLDMPGMNGVMSIGALLQAYPALPLVVLSGDESPATMRAALSFGALGFVPKRQSPSIMLKAIELVLSGGSYVPLEALKERADNDAAPMHASQSVGEGRGLLPHQRHLFENLSPRQQEIMRLVHLGRTNKMIARELGLAEGTVKVHLSVIFRALGVHNRGGAIAAINGWLEG